MRHFQVQGVPPYREGRGDGKQLQVQGVLPYREGGGGACGEWVGKRFCSAPLLFNQADL